MNPFNRKSPIQRLGNAVKGSVGSGSDKARDALPSSDKLLKALPGGDKSLKAAGLTAAGLAAVTAASAAVSSIRQRQEEDGDS